MTTLWQGGRREFKIETHTEQIGFVCREPDPAWRYVDADGHEHRWRRDGKDWEIPTTEYHETMEWAFGDDEGEPYQYSIGWRQCKQCHEKIEGGTWHVQQAMPGLTEWYGSFTCTSDEAAALLPRLTDGTIQIGQWNDVGLQGVAVVTRIEQASCSVPECDKMTRFGNDPATAPCFIEFRGQGPLTLVEKPTVAATEGRGGPGRET